jgi:hypothetical protein
MVRPTGIELYSGFLRERRRISVLVYRIFLQSARFFLSNLVRFDVIKSVNLAHVPLRLSVLSLLQNNSRELLFI